MRIGIGLPTTIPGVRAEQLLEWARRADRAGFSTLGTIDRIVHPNYESLIALGAAAAVTERIGLTTSILIVPCRGSAAILAKQIATVHALSGGRFVLGAAVGGRADDYEATGVPFGERGRRFEQMLDELVRIWGGERRGHAGGIGPDVSGDPPPIVIGGQVEATFRRAAKYGAGWIMGTAPPDRFPAGVEKLEAAWRAEGRDGEPRRMALAYFSLEDDPEAAARRSIGNYYAFAPDYAEMMVAGAAKGEDEVRERVRAFEQVGCDELIMCPASSDPAQVDELATAVLS
jgi:alkanesulfonate monooxygenase SsuD/methylene tetrahydromethanopterin reductase-like flavin-dependent oxidoreductase (luciferase family)